LLESASSTRRPCYDQQAPAAEAIGKPDLEVRALFDLGNQTVLAKKIESVVNERRAHIDLLDLKVPPALESDVTVGPTPPFE
jgi:hypothetical protein